MILTPDAYSLIPAAACKIVAEWTPADIPDWTLVTFEDAKTGERFQRPHSNSFIGGR